MRAEEPRVLQGKRARKRNTLAAQPKPESSMVRRGSTVRVRQRALFGNRTARKWAVFCCRARHRRAPPWKGGRCRRGNRLRRRKRLESRCLEGAHRSRGRSSDVGDRFWGHFDDVKAEVEHTALVSVEVDLETGDVASVGIHPTRDEDETPSEVTVSLRVASLLLRFCCGLWSGGDRGRFCQLSVEQEQQRFVVRERHPVGLPGVTQDLCGESDVVGGPGDESAVAGERLVHDFLATEARNGRLESGKVAPRPWLSHCGAIDSGAAFTLSDAVTTVLLALSYRTQSWSMSTNCCGLYW